MLILARKNNIQNIRWFIPGDGLMKEYFFKKSYKEIEKKSETAKEEEKVKNLIIKNDWQ